MAEQIPISLHVALDAAEAERTIVRFLHDYLADSGRKAFVIGISGGIDSAVSAALGVRAVGVAAVHGLVLPDATTSKDELRDASDVARWLGIDAPTLPLDPLLDAWRRTTKDDDRTRLGNAKARLRMMLLYDEAARRDALVLGTGNKSEMLTGYTSKHGDAGVDVQPIGDLYKTQVRHLAVHLGVPQRILDKAPTAGLWAGQTDEAELGLPYATLDRILLGLELQLERDRIARIVHVDEAEVHRIDRLRQRTQHKRRTPPIPKLGLRTVGIDWRQSLSER